MQIGRIQSAHPTHTGQLLISAGLLSHEKLDEALNLAKKLRMPLGRVLMMCGNLDQRNLESVLSAQALIRQEQINLELAVNFLNEAHKTRLTLEDILQQNGWQPHGPTVVSELGELLIAATVVERNQLLSALEAIEITDQTLGRYLLERKAVSCFDLMNALQALTAIKKGNMERTMAVTALRTAVASCITFDQAVRKSGGQYVAGENSTKLGELLSLAGLISDIDLSECIETALTREVPIGEVFVEHGIITRDFLHTSLDVQALLEQRRINFHQARELMLAVHSGLGVLQHCFAQLEAFCYAVLGLLVDANFVSSIDIKTARKVSQGANIDVPEVLYENGYIEKTALEVARRCQRMINEGFVTREQSVQVLASYKFPKDRNPNMEVTGVNETVSE